MFFGVVLFFHLLFQYTKSSDILKWSACFDVADVVNWTLFQEILIDGCVPVDKKNVGSKWPYKCNNEAVMESMSVFDDVFSRSLVRFVHFLKFSRR